MLEVNLHDVIEIDKSYFGPTRVHVKRGRVEEGKIIVFGLFKSGYKIYSNS